MTMRIGGFQSLFAEFFKNKQEEKAGNTDGSSNSVFDLVKSGAESSMSVDDLLSMDVQDGKFVKSSEDNDNENKSTDIASIINSYLEEESVIKALDSDNSGNLSKNELNAFLNTIKGNDKNIEDISLSDIYEASKQIDNDEFELITEETEEAEESDTAEEAQETEGAENAESGAAEGSESASGTGNAGGTSNSGGVGANNTNSINGSQYDLKAEGSYENMTEEELNAELDDAEAGITEGQEALNAVLSGTNEAVQNAQQNIDNAYNTYQEELKTLNEDMAKELDEIKQAADEKEKEVNTKKMEVSEQNTKVSECQSNYDNAVSTRQSLESTLASLESALSGAEEEEKAAIEAQIDSVKAQLEAAKQKEKEAKTKLEEAKTKLEQLKQEQTVLETDKTQLDQQETAKNQEILAQYPQLQQSQMAYTDAKSEYNTVKAAEEQEANDLLEHNQKIKSNVQAELTTRENKDKEKENTTSIKGDYDEEEGLSLVETAKKMLAKYGSTTGWCATGVSRTMAMHYGIQMGGHGYQWDSNMDKLVEQGMFQEVTSDYATSNDLSSLPAGAVVCWEGTGGTEGGAKYGHVTIADGNGGEISDHYQKNIYKSVGGGTTQYRVYIPV